jgi:hypothetical protein
VPRVHVHDDCFYSLGFPVQSLGDPNGRLNPGVPGLVVAVLENGGKGEMEIKNSSNPKDVVIVKESEPNHKDHVRLGIGITKEDSPRHANLTPAEARAVAYALLSYAEQVSDRRVES